MPGLVDIGRRTAGKPAKEAGEGPDEAVVAHVRVSVRDRARAQSRRRPRGVPPERDRSPVEVRREGADVRADERQAMSLEVEVPDDGWAEPPHGVREGRNERTRCELGGRGRATDRRPALEDHRPQAGSAEIGGGDKAVVAAADDDRVVVVGRHRLGHLPTAGPEDLQRGDPAVGAHDPAARVGRRTAQPQVADRRSEAGVAGDGSIEEELLQ